jgi:hypothetical protein
MQDGGDEGVSRNAMYSIAQIASYQSFVSAIGYLSFGAVSVCRGRC